MKNKLLIAGLITLASVSAVAKNKVVYGIDNRFEISNSPYSGLKKSVAGMVDKYSIKEVKNEKGEVLSHEIKYYGDLTTYQGRKTCDDMQFREQPTAASCTGFLIAEDMLVTAGHCVVRRGQKVENKQTYSCKNNKWVFGYETASEKDGKLKFAKDDVYECAEVIAGEYSELRDYAIVKLTKKTVGKTPVKLDAEKDNYKKGEDIFVVGHPSGLPMKIAAGAEVMVNQDESRFLTNLDTFAGNSGSPIFNFWGDVIGILVSGETDYYYDYTRGCMAVNKCDDYDKACNRAYTGKARGETGTKISLVLEALKKDKEKKDKKEVVQKIEEVIEEIEVEEVEEIEVEIEL
ncbi:MAG: hypothetical protein BM556_12310 [Bacteriovorax sp. MedPE-SWde]|nr:MAG: hypothetical protein BM556_12310 [Bacteriovorax sp. MedPE-SWde]